MLGLRTLFFRKKRTRYYQAPEQVLDNLKDAVLVLGENQIIEHFNAFWSKIVKLKDRDIRHSNFSAYIHPDDHNVWYRAIEGLSAHNHSDRVTLRILSRSQEITWCEVHLQQMDPEQVFPITLSLSDVTVKKQQLDIHKAGHRNINGLVSRMPAILYRGLNNTQWTMEYISDGCFELTGYHPAQLLNQTQFSFGDLIHPEDAQEVWETVQLAIQKQCCFDLTYRLRHRDGSYKNVIEKGQGVYSPSGSVLSIEGIILQHSLRELS